MRIYVTGASGLLGRELAPRLRAAGHELVGSERVEITAPEGIARAIVAARPDWVVHLAAYTRVDDAETEPEVAATTNIAGTVFVARGARAAGARLFYMSTDYVYDGEKSSPYVETDPPHPISAYGRSKLGGELAAAAVVPEVLIVRGGWLYGPGRGFPAAILRAAAAGGASLRVVTDELGCPTAAGDLAAAIERLLGVGAQGIVHVANAGGVTRFDLARTVLELAGEDPARVQPITQAQNQRAARRPRAAVLELRRFADLTGVPLRAWEKALAEHLAGAQNPESGAAGAQPEPVKR
ncbi:MAG TPA: dTDP-4-dehydrorhamnose reductase [Candidatus Udaeobacter sp.]|nr:dTDP-4-dehydrorhamnose reductase [Candidatus Udaeobacter sp.]